MQDAFPPLPDCTPVWDAVCRWYHAKGTADIFAARHAVDDAVHSMLVSYVATDRLTRMPPPNVATTTTTEATTA